MNYLVHTVTINNDQLYITEDSKITCIDTDPVFQQWLRDNADNLPADIQAKVEAGTLTIEEADNGSE